MAVIGDISILFSGDTSGLAKAGKKAEGIAGGTINKLSGLGSDIFSGIASGVAGLPGMIGGALSSINSLNAAFVQLGIDGIKTFLSTAAQFATQGFEIGDVLGDTAAQIGTTADRLNLLEQVTQMSGGKVESLAGSLQKLGKNLASNEAGDVVKKLGLDINQLLAADPVDAFFQIQEAWDGMATSGQQTSDAMKLFGKSGADMLNVLRANSEVVKTVRQDMKDFGLEFTALDSSGIDDVNMQFDRVGGLLKSIKLVLAGELAPIVSAAIKQMIDWAKEAGNVRTTIQTLVTYTAFGFDVIVNTINLATAVLGPLVSVTLLQASAMAKVVEWTARLKSFLPGIGNYYKMVAEEAKNFSEFAYEGSKTAMEQSGKAWDRAAEGSNIQGWLDGVRDKAKQAADEVKKIKPPTALEVGAQRFTEELDKLTDKLNLEISIHGLDDTQKKLHTLAHELDYTGPVEELSKEFVKLSRELENLNAEKAQFAEWAKVGQEAFDSTRTSSEKLLAEMNKLREASGAGLVEYESGVRKKDKLQKDFLSGLGIDLQTNADKFKEKFSQLQDAFNNKNISREQLDKGKEKLKKDVLGGIGVDLQSPLDKFKEQFEQLKGIEKFLSPEEFSKANLQMNRDFFKNTPQFSSAVEFGTQKARDLTLRSIFGQNSSDPLKDSVNIQRGSLDKLELIRQGILKLATPDDKVVSIPR